MRDKENTHVKVQEMVDCYAETHPLEEMAKVPSEEDREEAALKWLALATLHGINQNAEKITITRSPEGEVSVTATYRDAELPSPGPVVGANVVEDVRSMVHIAEDEGSLPLVLGVRNDSVNIGVKVSRKGGGETVSLEFPEET